MPKNTNRRVQTSKSVRSPGAKALTISRRGGAGDRIPSATAYSRTSSKRSWKAEL